MYDVFVNIRDDEVEHVRTMNACNHGTVQLRLEVRGHCPPGCRLPD
jgi:hypothetical protein